MKTNIFSKINLIINVLILFSLICTYTLGLNPFFTFTVIFLILIFSDYKETVDKKSFYVFLPVLILFLLILLPNFNYPTIHSDFYNHASISRLISEKGVYDSLFHTYPHGTHSFLAALIQILPFNFFQTTSIVGVMLFLLSIINFNQLSNKLLKNPKKSLFATIIFTFSITTIWNLQLGFIPSVLAFYLIINSLLYERDNPFFSILNGASLATVYPHYFVILCFYYLVKGAVNKDLFYSIKQIIWFLLIGGFEFFLTVYGILVVHLDTIVLMKGGIFVPNIIFIILFLTLFGLSLKKFKITDLKTNMVLLFFSIFLLQIVLSAAVIFNWLLDITGLVTLKQFYMVVKLFYFQMIPLSIFFADKIDLKKKMLFSISAIMLLLFVGYLLYVDSNIYISNDIMDIGQVISTILPENVTISLDPTILENVEYNPPAFYYDSLIRLSDDYSDLIRLNVEKSLRADWMSFGIGGFTFNNISIFDYNNSGEYYIGYEEVIGEIICVYGNLRVIKTI